MKLSLGFAAAVLIGASTAVPAALQSRKPDTCYTVHQGYFLVHPNGGDAGVTLNQQNQVVYGKPGKLLKVQFQACPKLLGNIPEDDKWVGRIVSGGKCLTITNANSTVEPYFAKVAGCSSNTSPSVAQTWKYGTGDDRGVVVDAQMAMAILATCPRVTVTPSSQRLADSKLDAIISAPVSAFAPS
ncbi:hypothetical protein FS837_004706 [Tulasnella sp. UAMH 9824]|nr:hypothetical protein FS837_004706 [Tulasnella sp. UAMH 9824]